MRKITTLPIVLFFILSTLKAEVIYFPVKNLREQVTEKKAEINESGKTLHRISVYPKFLKRAGFKIIQSPVLQKKQGISLKEYKQLKGGKLTFKERIFFLFQKRFFQQRQDSGNLGLIALIIGIIGLALFIIGIFFNYVLIGSLIAAITALILGIIGQQKNPNDSKAKAGKILGWITLILMVLLAILAVILIASFFSIFN